MEELASIPDASEANCRRASGFRNLRRLWPHPRATGAPQSKPPRRPTVAVPVMAIPAITLLEGRKVAGGVVERCGVVGGSIGRGAVLPAPSERLEVFQQRSKLLLAALPMLFGRFASLRPDGSRDEVRESHLAPCGAQLFRRRVLLIRDCRETCSKRRALRPKFLHTSSTITVG